MAADHDQIGGPLRVGVRDRRRGITQEKERLHFFGNRRAPLQFGQYLRDSLVRRLGGFRRRNRVPAPSEIAGPITWMNAISAPNAPRSDWNDDLIAAVKWLS
jgi:hypothetical protein